MNKLWRKLSLASKRLYHYIRDNHTWVTKDHVRYCVGCAWMELRDEDGKWHFDVDEVDDDFMTPSQMIQASEEIQEALEAIRKVWGELW